MIYADQRDEKGYAQVVLSGHSPARGIQTGIGLVTVQVHKVRSRQCKPVTFHSALVARLYTKRQASSRVPWIYLKEISTGDMQPVLEAFVGLEPKGCPASAVYPRLK